MKKQKNQQNPESTKEQQLFLKIRNGNIRINGKQSIPKAEEGYCNEATKAGLSLTAKATKHRIQGNIQE
jgi:hypothetical protein